MRATTGRTQIKFTIGCKCKSLHIFHKNVRHSCEIKYSTSLNLDNNKKVGAFLLTSGTDLLNVPNFTQP